MSIKTNISKQKEGPYLCSYVCYRRSWCHLYIILGRLNKSLTTVGTAATSFASPYYLARFVKFSNLILKDSKDGTILAILQGLGLLLEGFYGSMEDRLEA